MWPRLPRLSLTGELVVDKFAHRRFQPRFYQACVASCLGWEDVLCGICFREPSSLFSRPFEILGGNIDSELHLQETGSKGSFHLNRGGHAKSLFDLHSSAPTGMWPIKWVVWSALLIRVCQFRCAMMVIYSGGLPIVRLVNVLTCLPPVQPYSWLIPKAKRLGSWSMSKM